MSQPEVLTVPGRGGSGPGHLQTASERARGWIRVRQREWDRPVPADWVDGLERAVARAVRPVLLVAPADVDSLSLLGDWPHGPRLLGEPGMAHPGLPA